MKTYIKVSPEHCVGPGMEIRLPVQRNAYFDSLKEGESFEGVLRFQEYDEGMDWWDDISEREFQEFDAYHRRVIIPVNYEYGDGVPEAGGKVEQEGELNVADEAAMELKRMFEDDEIEVGGGFKSTWMNGYCVAANKYRKASQPDSPNRLGEIVGKWPGDETTEEIINGLKDSPEAEGIDPMDIERIGLALDSAKCVIDETGALNKVPEDHDDPGAIRDCYNNLLDGMETFREIRKRLEEYAQSKNSKG